MGLHSEAVAIQHVRVSPFVVPTDGMESDGTLEWDRTGVVLVETTGGGQTGIGWTYAGRAAATVVHDILSDVVRGQDVMSIPSVVHLMANSVRNEGRSGVAAMAMAAVEASLWDLKAKILHLSLVQLLGARRPAVPAYGSGGFTSYSDDQLREQLGRWVAEGMSRVKMKVGREPTRDPSRVNAARSAIGEAQLFVDANGAYTRKQALALAHAFHALSVVWFEEPISSDDLDGLTLVRDRAPAGMDVAAGEYGYDLLYFRRMLEAQAVDVLQADATRCGISGFLRADALCEAFGVPLSAHCAPTIHAHVACAAACTAHVEYFYDHSRIEHMLLDGALAPSGGKLHPSLSRPGLGVEIKRKDAMRFAV